jgi:hypothetical protein
MEVSMPDDGRQVLESSEARQGETSGRMRIVLGISLILILAVFAGAWWIESHRAPDAARAPTSQSMPAP